MIEVRTYLEGDDVSNGERERALTAVFVELADTMVSDFDVTDLLQRLIEHSVELLDADAAGLLLSDQRGSLQLVAASTEASRVLELFQLQTEEGPCLDCFRSGQQVIVPDLRAVRDRWPRFSAVAEDQGFQAVHAVPLRLRDDVIGAMNLFNRDPRALTAEDLSLAQALADVSTIGILQERAIEHGELLVEQLQGALNSRVVIEQAKGLLADTRTLDMNEAFNRLRQMSRNTNTRLADVARALVEGRLPAAQLDGPPTEPEEPTRAGT